MISLNSETLTMYISYGLTQPFVLVHCQRCLQVLTDIKVKSTGLQYQCRNGLGNGIVMVKTEETS